MEESNATPSPRVLLFPFLAHSHISSFLELAKTLSKNHFQVYFCSTPINLKPIVKKLSSYSIEQVEIKLPSSPDLPSHYHTSSGLPPHLVFALIEALEKSAPTFAKILESLQPDLVIYDTRQSWLPPISASYGIPAVLFQTTGATATSFHFQKLLHPGLNFPSPGIFLRSHETSFRRVKSPSNDTHESVQQFLNCAEQSTEILLIKSCREIEGRYIDFHSSLFSNQKKMIPLGALTKKPEDEEEDDSTNHRDIIQWLNGKKKASSVYVSFGSECYLTKEEYQELALGLELSNVDFIWVVRTPNGEKTSLEEILPKGFLERVKGRGIIVEGWAPQATILKHENIGGFVSHCGWGSLLESMSFGVPIIAVPMQYDQPVNARLVVEIGVGLEVIRSDDGKLNGAEVTKIVKKVVVEDAGEGLRRRAKELAVNVQRISREETYVAVEELRRICIKNNN